MKFGFESMPQGQPAPQEGNSNTWELEPMLVKETMQRFSLGNMDSAFVERQLDAEASVLKGMGDSKEEIIKALEFKLRGMGAVEYKKAS